MASACQRLAACANGRNCTVSGRINELASVVEIQAAGSLREGLWGSESNAERRNEYSRETKNRVIEHA